MTITVDETVVRRVKKLLDLAQNAGSEHEAAAASERAADLMHKHQITQAQLRLLDPMAAPVEPIRDGFVLDTTKKRVAWKASLSAGLVVLYGCHDYWSWSNGKWIGSHFHRQREVRLIIFGRESAVNAVAYNFQYLVREIDELCEKAWRATGRDYGAKGWKNAFRLGAANVICARLHDKAEADKTARAAAIRQAVEPALRNSHDGEAAVAAKRSADELVAELLASDLPASTVALAVVAKDETEVDEAFGKVRERFTVKTMGSLGRTVSSRSGYEQGKAAGEKVRLAPAKGRLPKAPDQITSKRR